MTTIELHTTIDASLIEVFDLSRSIDFHMKSASKTKERAIAGRITGLIGFGETVTWRGKHFGIFLEHTSKIIDYERPHKFTDIMIKDHFKYFCHQHFFKHEQEKTIMTDVLKYRTPYGFFGNLFDHALLRRHLTRFLQHRNELIKITAEKHPV